MLFLNRAKENLRNFSVIKNVLLHVQIPLKRQQLEIFHSETKKFKRKSILLPRCGSFH